VKGYEYEKGKFVVLKEEDFARVDIEATQTVDILNFVSLDEVNPLLFYKPYYMEAGKGGDRAYVLLREALNETGKIAIAKVVIRTRQHLAAVKPQEHGLMLELMHFPQEILDASEFKSPAEKVPSKPEMTMAKQLISSMTDKWKPEQYTDEYRDALEKMIEDKLEHGEETTTPSKKRAKPTNVIDLVSVLQQSIEKTSGKSAPARKAAKKTTKKTRKKAA
jgi:DNA end-binding protein Ku